MKKNIDFLKIAQKAFKIIKTIIISPLFSAFIWATFTICIVFIGIFSDSILNSVDKIEEIESFAGALNLLPNWQITLFIVTALTLSLSVAQKALTQAEQKEDIKRLEEIVRTLPNITAISQSGHMFPKHLYLTIEALEDFLCGSKKITKDKIQEAIRGTLDSILTVTKAFDDAEDNDIYAANIMKVHSFEDKKNQDAFKGKILFNKLDTEHLAAALALDPALSTKSNSDKKIDPDVQEEFVLPLHKEEEYVLPGAPKAFRTNQMMIVHSMDELLKVIQGSDMLKNTRDQILDHFKSTRIKAFISVPISYMIKNDKDKLIKPTIAILNIHKFSPHIIRTNMALNDDGMQKKSTSVYFSMIQPYLNLLAHLIKIETQMK